VEHDEVVIRSKPVTRCRSCAGPEVVEFITLGSTPIANRLVDPAHTPAADPTFPLSVGHCASCSLVQLTHELPAEAIFDSDYPYFSSYSQDLVAHSHDHVDRLMSERQLSDRSLVVELASNDGYLLGHFLPHRVSVLGVEPSPGPASAARQAGVPTMESFFDADLAASIRKEHGPADVIIANNVLAHVPNLNSFMAGMAALVKDDGIIQIENPSVQFLIEQTAFDTIYHEHFCYFSSLAIQQLLRRHGLHLHDIELFPGLHGGTLRWTCGKAERRSANVDDRLAAEAAAGLHESATFAAFANQVARTQADLGELLRALRAAGATIAAYGAAAKGATLLNSSGIGRDVIDYVVDRNPFKQGKLLPGVRIPIIDPSALIERRPDYLLLLAWNFRDEIVRQQSEYVKAGGRFIIPVPKARIL
jgi:SAM-dependent methyltransferase